jgi:hypothetical protein
MPAPGANACFISGSWIYREGRYRWRPGFWLTHRPGWVWIPAHYFWTPAGFIFVDGYWDRPLEMRGLLFAPVRFARRLLGAPQFAFIPQYTVQPDFLLSALFVRPNLGHYYFGDYFDQRYTQAGFIPWVDYRMSRWSYDPNFSYYRAGFSGAANWERNLRALYQARFRGDVPRPPRTLIQQNEVMQTLAANQTQNVAVNRSFQFTNVQNVSVLAPVSRVRTIQVTHLAGLGGLSAPPPTLVPRGAALRLQAIPREQRIQHQQAAVQVHALAQERRKQEAQLLTAGPPTRITDAPRQVQIPLPQSPQVPRPGGVLPPNVPVMPKHEDHPIPRHDPIRMPPPPPPPSRPTPPPKKEKDKKEKK